MSLLHGDSADPLKWAVKGQQLMQSVNYEDVRDCNTRVLYAADLDIGCEVLPKGRRQESRDYSSRQNARRGCKTLQCEW